jgi:hypothetical protein
MKLIGRAFWETDRHRPGRWAHKYRDADGRERKLRVPREVAPTQRERAAAEEWARVEVARMQEPQAPVVTVESLAWRVGALWLRDARIARATLDDRSSHLRLHILPAFDRVPIASLGVPSVRGWVRSMREGGASKSAASNRLSTLAKLLDADSFRTREAADRLLRGAGPLAHFSPDETASQKVSPREWPRESGFHQMLWWRRLPGRVVSQYKKSD